MTVAVRVIPCLDVDGGRVVKGVNFRELRDAGDPVELAAFYDAEGADELTFLDITASSGGRDTMYDVVRRTAEQVFIPLTVGGGVRGVAEVDKLLRFGADKASINTAAVARPDVIDEITRHFGSQGPAPDPATRRPPCAGATTSRRAAASDRCSSLLAPMSLFYATCQGIGLAVAAGTFAGASGRRGSVGALVAIPSAIGGGILFAV